MSKANDEGEKKVVKLTPMKDGKTFLMAPADYRNLFEKDKEPKEAKESTAKESKDLKEPKEDKEPKEAKEPKEPKEPKEADSKVSKESPNSGGSSMFGKATVPDADDGISKRQSSSKLKRADSKSSLKKVKRTTPAFADKDHPPNKKSQERLNRSHSHRRHGHSHSHGHGHKSSAENKKSRSKKSLHSQKNCSKNKGCSGVSGTGSTIGGGTGTHSHHGSKSKEQPVTMSIGTMTVINYGGSSDGPLPKGVPGVPGSSKANEPSPPTGPNRGEKADNSKAA